MSEALSVEYLCKQYGALRAVDGLSFTVKPGEIVGLLGPNGAGKSTTFLCLAGLLRPDSGKIILGSRALGPERGHEIALIPETPEVYDLLTVWEHMVFVARSVRLRPGWEARAKELLDRFNLWQKRNELGSALSKGMKQKTLIAATVLAQSPVLLFDEPTVGLDPLGQRELRDIMLSLKNEGCALMMSTHMLREAQTLCDRVLIMKAGRLVQSGTFEELHHFDPQAPDLESIFLSLTV